MTKLTDKEILDFVRKNLTLDKNSLGAVYLGGVSCNIIGDVEGYIIGNVDYIERSVSGSVGGNVKGNMVAEGTRDRHEWVELALSDIDDTAVSKDWLAGARWAGIKLKEKNND